MNPPNMLNTHVSEQDLVLHLYGESSDEQMVSEHLQSCARCREEVGRLREVLTLVDTSDAFGPVDAPGPAFEREVWARLEPQLTTRRGWFGEWFTARRWAVAGGVAGLLLVAFLAGRFSRDQQTAPMSADVDSGVAERVLVVAVVDHLDRSQMVLLEVLNADVESAGDLEAEQALARELVTANRLYRQTAVQTGNGGTNDVLDELERTLLEIANTPSDATKDEIDALRARIASRGLLFKVRVVHSELLERERQNVVPGSQS
jgi:hypothetical protein